MEIVLFTGIPASGKSTFYKQNFYDTHIRINLDMLRTRKREDILIEACIKAKQTFVVDNTNTTIEERKKYINIAKQAGVPITGYFFESSLQDAMIRNEGRAGKARIPGAAITAFSKKLVIPSYAEGFDTLYHVRAQAGNIFLVEEIPKQSDDT